MKDGSENLAPPATDDTVALRDQLEALQIRLKHIENDYTLTKREYDAATGRYLEVLAEVNRKNRELEQLKNQLEKRVQERTALLELSNQALRESENRLQMVLQATSDGVWDRNLVTGEVYFSPTWARIFGYRPDEVEPHIRTWQKLLHPDDCAAVAAALEAHLAGQAPQYSVEARLRHRDGQWRWVLSRGKIVARDDTGRPVRMLGTDIDITARKAAEEQMVRAAKMLALGTLVAGVAHEINNPNNFIMLGVPILEKYFQGLLRILEEKNITDDVCVANVRLEQVRQDLPRLLNGVMEGARRIRNIVRDLRDFARPDTSEMDQRVNINEVLRTVVNLLQGALRKATANFTADYAEGLPAVIGNAHKLEQVFVNLLKNACEALPDKSRAITLTTGYDGARRQVWVRVADQGCGIAPEIRGFVFDPFFTTKREQGNAGLGLTIAARILDLHRAALEIETQPNTGTTLTVRFSLLAMQ